MNRWAKFAVVGSVALLGAVVGLRELTRAPLPTKGAHGHGHDDGPKEKAASSAKDAHGHDHGHGEQGEGFVKLTPQQVAAAGIDLAPAASGMLVLEIAVPGRVSVNAERLAKIVPKVSGTVAKINKQLGDPVTEHETLAILESRDMAEAKADYLAAWRAEELAKSTLVREERLWKQKVTAEQDYLNSRNAHQAAKIKLDLAHQRLHTVGLSEVEIDAIRTATDGAKLRFYEIRSPLPGRITARNLLPGQFVGTEKDVFTVADLSTVWIEMAISPNDLGFAKVGQEVRVQSGGRRATGRIVAVSPAIDPDTRSAKVIAEIANASGEWNVGDFVGAQLIAGQQDVSLLVPREAIQTIKGAKAVFVSQGGGFKMRQVTTGREDTVSIEILSGLEFGESIAVKNTFALKAELGKSEAEHQH